MFKPELNKLEDFVDLQYAPLYQPDVFNMLF